jgi:threonine dehydratase
MAGELNYGLIVEHVRDMVTVSDAQIVDAMMVLLERAKLLVEPAGAAGLAGLLSGSIPLEAGVPVAVVLSGGNVDLELLARLIPQRT